MRNGTEAKSHPAWRRWLGELPYAFRVFFSVVLAAIALVTLVSVASEDYDPTENRAPEARIIVAALATVAALASVGVASLRVSPRRARLQQVSAQWVAAMLLWGMTLLLLVLEFVIVDASGRL